MPPKNYFRHFLGRLHRLQDFQFIVDGMLRTLNQPVNSPLQPGVIIELMRSSYKQPHPTFPAAKGPSDGAQR